MNWMRWRALAARFCAPANENCKYLVLTRTALPELDCAWMQTSKTIWFVWCYIASLVWISACMGTFPQYRHWLLNVSSSARGPTLKEMMDLLQNPGSGLTMEENTPAGSWTWAISTTCERKSRIFPIRHPHEDGGNPNSVTCGPSSEKPDLRISGHDGQQLLWVGAGKRSSS